MILLIMDVIFVSFLWSARRRGTKSFLTVLQCPSLRIMYLSLVWSSCRRSFFKSRKHASHKAQLECCTQKTLKTYQGLHLPLHTLERIPDQGFSLRSLRGPRQWTANDSPGSTSTRSFVIANGKNGLLTGFTWISFKILFRDSL